MIGKFIAFVKEVRVEMGKVSWSSREELINSTWVVLVSSAILAALVGAFDFFCTTFVRLLIR